MRDPRVTERRAIVEQLMLGGFSIAQVIAYGRRQGWSEATVRHDHALINDQWGKQNEEELQFARAQAVQRIRSDLARMRLKLDQQAPKGRGAKKQQAAFNAMADATWKDINAHEMLLARIEGTLRPVEVKVDVRATSRRALIDVINGMSPEEMDRMIAEQRELESRSRG